MSNVDRAFGCMLDLIDSNSFRKGGGVAYI